jgi:hypothetical protein
MPHSLETLTVDAFQPRVGQTFRIRPRPGTDRGRTIRCSSGGMGTPVLQSIHQ